MTKRKTKFDISLNRCVIFGTLITDTSRVHANPANQCSYCCFPSRKTIANQYSFTWKSRNSHSRCGGLNVVGEMSGFQTSRDSGGCQF